MSDAGESEATGATPVPESETEGGVPGALLLSVSVLARVPTAVGTNVTLTVQEVPLARLAGQLFVCAKSPDNANPLIESGPVPVLLRVRFCAELVVPTDCAEKVSEETLNLGITVKPVPDKETVCGLPPRASSATESTPERVPDVDGVNVTFIVQFTPAPRLAGQLLVCAKSPLVEMEEMLSEVLPVLVSVTD